MPDAGTAEEPDNGTGASVERPGNVPVQKHSPTGTDIDYVDMSFRKQSGPISRVHPIPVQSAREPAGPDGTLESVRSHGRMLTDEDMATLDNAEDSDDDPQRKLRKHSQSAVDCLRFLWRNSSRLLDLDNNHLVSQEPEVEQFSCPWFVKWLLVLLIVVLFLNIFVATSFAKYGMQKSQTERLVHLDVLAVPMSYALLPLHHIAVFSKSELTNRMECLLKNSSEPCVHYCQTLQRHSPDPSSEDLFQCYKRYNVSDHFYAEERCSSLFDVESHEYAECIHSHGMRLTQRQSCDKLAETAADRLDCYLGRASFDFLNATVPLDRDVCKLIHDVNNETEKALFACYRRANVTLERGLCDELYPTDAEAFQDSAAALESRFGCYRASLGIPKGKEYCAALHSDTRRYYECLPRNNFTTGADFCYYEFWAPDFYQPATDAAGNYFRLYRCLQEEGLESDAHSCSFELEELQRARYTGATTKITFTQVEKCFASYSLPADYLRCQYEQNPYYGFAPSEDVDSVEYLAKEGSAFTDRECTNLFQLATLTKKYNLEAPEPHAAMAASASDKCERILFDESRFLTCITPPPPPPAPVVPPKVDGGNASANGSSSADANGTAEANASSGGNVTKPNRTEGNDSLPANGSAAGGNGTDPVNPQDSTNSSSSNDSAASNATAANGTSGGSTASDTNSSIDANSSIDSNASIDGNASTPSDGANSSAPSPDSSGNASANGSVDSNSSAVPSSNSSASPSEPSSESSANGTAAANASQGNSSIPSANASDSSNSSAASDATANATNATANLTAAVEQAKQERIASCEEQFADNSSVASRGVCLAILGLPHRKEDCLVSAQATGPSFDFKLVNKYHCLKNEFKVTIDEQVEECFAQQMVPKIEACIAQVEAENEMGFVAENEYGIIPDNETADGEGADGEEVETFPTDIDMEQINDFLCNEQTRMSLQSGQAKEARSGQGRLDSKTYRMICNSFAQQEGNQTLVYMHHTFGNGTLTPEAAGRRLQEDS